MRRLIAAVVALVAVWPAAAQAQVPDLEADLRGCDPLDEYACLLPFPNDFFTRPDPSTDTGRRVSLPLTGMPRNVAGKPIDPTEWNRADGFSPGSPIITRIPGLDTPQAFANTGSVPITDVARYTDPDAPVVVLDAETGERHPIWTELDSNASSAQETTFVIRPARNFEEGRRYIVALRDLRDAEGDPIGARGTFRNWRDRPFPGRGNGRRAHFEEIFDTLADAGIARSSLYLAWDFTVASESTLTGRMLELRDESFAALGDTNLADLTVQGSSPAFTVETVTDFTAAQNDRIARRIEGTFEVPCWLAAGADCSSGQRFAIGDDGLPARPVDGTWEANFTCQIPRVTVDGEGVRPARPALYGHGLLGSVSEMNQSQLRSLGNEHNFVFCGTNWIGMSEEDVPTILGTVVTDLSNFPVLADRVQQGMLDFLFLGRLMLHPDGFASHAAFRDEGQPVIDPARLFYDGNSQGGIVGGALAAVAVDFDRAVLGVPGMNYSTLLQRSIDFVGTPLREFAAEAPERVQRALEEQSEDPLIDGVSFSTALYETYPHENERQLVFALMQMLWDRAEANGYAHHVTDDPLPNTPSHEVMYHVAFGDHQVANVTTQVAARTVGARRMHVRMLDDDRDDTLDPFSAIEAFPGFPSTGSALVFWDTGPIREVNGRIVGTDPPPATNTPPRAGQDPHEYPRRQPHARAQKSAFLRIGGQVIDTCGGGPCYADPTR